MKCEVLTNTTKRLVKFRGVIIGAVAMYSCVTGYSLEGNGLRKCNNNEKWSGSEPSCKVSPNDRVP